MTTKIEWADATINPVVGCSHCSPGCDNCYAERFAARMAKNPNPKISGKYAGVVDENGKWTGRVNLHMDGCLYAATVTRKPKRFFIGSMTDIFHENIPDEEIRSLFLSMTIVPNDLPTYMVLTKRPHRARAVLEDMLISCPELHRVWLGVTVCNHDELWKLDTLREIPAALRYVSFEPLLSGLGKVNLEGIGWVICGGETGPGARPMHPDWVRSLRDQCQAAGTPFFFKGWGEWVTENQSPEDIVLPGHSTIPRGWKGRKYEDSVYRVGKRRAGRLLDGREWNEFPEESC